MDITIIILIQAVVSAIFCGVLSYHKNQNIPMWIVSGFFFGIFALIAAAGMPVKKDEKFTKQCSQCGLDIPVVAKVCPYCGNKYSTDEIVSFIEKLLKKQRTPEMILSASAALIELSDIKTIPVLLSMISNYNVDKMIRRHIINMGKPALEVLNEIKDSQTKYIQTEIDSIIKEINR